MICTICLTFESANHFFYYDTKVNLTKSRQNCWLHKYSTSGSVLRLHFLGIRLCLYQLCTTSPICVMDLFSSVSVIVGFLAAIRTNALLTQSLTFSSRQSHGCALFFPFFFELDLMVPYRTYFYNQTIMVNCFS